MYTASKHNSRTFLSQTIKEGKTVVKGRKIHSLFPPLLRKKPDVISTSTTCALSTLHLTLTNNSDIVDHRGGEIESDVVSSLDDGHRMVLILVIYWQSASEDEERVGVRVQPGDLADLGAAVLSRTLEGKKGERGRGRGEREGRGRGEGGE